MRYLIPVVFLFALALAPRPALAAQPVQITVTLDDWINTEDARGRLIVYLIKDDTGLDTRTRPAEGPFLSTPQPIFALDASGPDAWGDRAITIDDSADWFLVKPSELSAGVWRAQAVIDRRQWDSAWYREPGNWFSDQVVFRVSEDAESTRKVELKIDEPVNDRGQVAGRIFKTVEIISDELSNFYNVDAALRAAIVLPIDYDEDRAYPAIFKVPGFGADDSRAYDQLTRREHDGLLPGEYELYENAVVIYLNPEGPNGHHHFIDSEVNGPLETALVKELIPAIEKEIKLIPEPTARIITGHSSGGWSATWLTLHNPNVFGAAWASAPDPLDFRAFQRVNIYEQPNMYEADGEEIISRKNHTPPDLTVRMENRMEEVIGPNATSSQQWDAWQAAFGPRATDNSWTPRPLFDVQTGAIDPEVARHFRKFDIGALTRDNPGWYTKLLENRVRIVIGAEDEYGLNRGAELLKQIVEESEVEDGPGYIKILPNYGHSGIRRSDEVRAFPQEMLDYFKKHGHIPTD